MRGFSVGFDWPDRSRLPLYVGAPDTVPRGFIQPHGDIPLPRGPLNDVRDDVQHGLHLYLHYVLTAK